MLGEIGAPNLGLLRDYRYFGVSSRSWPAGSGRATAAILALLLGVTLLVAINSCTFGDVVIYKYETNPRPTAAPLGKIGPS